MSEQQDNANLVLDEVEKNLDTTVIFFEDHDIDLKTMRAIVAEEPKICFDLRREPGDEATVYFRIEDKERVTINALAGVTVERNGKAVGTVLSASVYAGSMPRIQVQMMDWDAFDEIIEAMKRGY
jgi:hypothetical protein